MNELEVLQSLSMEERIKRIENLYDCGYGKIHRLYIESANLEEAHAYTFIGENEHNPHGVSHGGATYGFADAIASIPCLMNLDLVVTQDASNYFLLPVKPGRLDGRVEVIKKGKRSYTIDVWLYQEDVCVFKNTSTMAIIHREKFPNAIYHK